MNASAEKIKGYYLYIQNVGPEIKVFCELYTGSYPDKPKWADHNPTGETPGECIKSSFNNQEYHVPQIVEHGGIRIEQDTLKKLNLEKKLLNFVINNGGNLVKWEMQEAKQPDGTTLLNPALFAEFKNMNTHAFVGLFIAAIKQNSAALGKAAVLFDTQSAEKIPEIKAYVNQYLQREI